MPAARGNTGKSSRWAFLVDCEHYDPDLIHTVLMAANFCAAYSPVHDLDVWEKADILKYMQSRVRQRLGVLFFYDDDFAPSDGYTYKDCLARNELPLYVAWPVTCAAPGDSEHYDVKGDWIYKELPAEGETKQKHRHVQIYADYAMPWETAFAKLENAGLSEEMIYYVEPTGSWDGLLRYYAHMDNPEKAQYNVNDVVSVYGFDLSPLYRKTEAAKVSEFEYVYSIVRQLPAKDANLMAVTDLLIMQNRPELAYKLSGKSGYWREIIYQMKEQDKRLRVDRDNQDFADRMRKGRETPEERRQRHRKEAEAVLKPLGLA